MDYYMFFQGYYCRINFFISIIFVEDFIIVNLEVFFQKIMFFKYFFVDVIFKSLFSMFSFFLKNNFFFFFQLLQRIGVYVYVLRDETVVKLFVRKFDIDVWYFFGDLLLGVV